MLVYVSAQKLIIFVSLGLLVYCQEARITPMESYIAYILCYFILHRIRPKQARPEQASPPVFIYANCL